MTVGVAWLIDRAEAVLNPILVGDRWFGDVGAALETTNGSIYVGVSVDTGSSGFCAERAAAAAMVTAGEYRIRRLVAVWRDSRPGADSTVYVLPPCGVCRQFIYDLAAENLDALIVTGVDEEVPLGKLLPRHGWSPKPAHRADP